MRSIITIVLLLFTSLVMADTSAIVRDKVVQNISYNNDYWFTKDSFLSSDGVCIIEFTILKNGGVKDIRVTKRTCDLAKVGEVKRGILKSQPFPIHEKDTRYRVEVEFRGKR